MHIYAKANSREDLDKYELYFRTLYNSLLLDLKNNNENSDIFTVFLHNMDSEYIKNTKKERIVLDYIAGMTDEFFLNSVNVLMKKY